MIHIFPFNSLIPFYCTLYLLHFLLFPLSQSLLFPVFLPSSCSLYPKVCSSLSFYLLPVPIIPKSALPCLFTFFLFHIVHPCFISNYPFILFYFPLSIFLFIFSLFPSFQHLLISLPSKHPFLFFPPITILFSFPSFILSLLSLHPFFFFLSPLSIPFSFSHPLTIPFSFSPFPYLYPILSFPSISRPCSPFSFLSPSFPPPSPFSVGFMTPVLKGGSSPVKVNMG